MTTLHPVSSKCFSENDFMMEYEFEQTSLNSHKNIAFQHYLQGDVDVSFYTILIALFKAEIKML